jgi:hypothetical protein
MQEITDSLGRALDRIADFEAVHSDATRAELLDAVGCLQESVGIGDSTRAVLKHRLLTDENRSKAIGPILLGVIVGLTAAELEGEARAEAA